MQMLGKFLKNTKFIFFAPLPLFKKRFRATELLSPSCSLIVMNNCNCEFSFVIIVHYVETEQIELKVKTVRNQSKGHEVSFSFHCYFIFASGVKNRTVICKNCRNIFRCLVKMMKNMRYFFKLVFHGQGAFFPIWNKSGQIWNFSGTEFVN